MQAKDNEDQPVDEARDWAIKGWVSVLEWVMDRHDPKTMEEAFDVAQRVHPEFGDPPPWLVQGVTAHFEKPAPRMYR